MNGFSTVFNPDHAIRIRLTSPWLAKLTFSQSLGIDIPSSELRMRITHSRYKQLFSNLQLQSRVRSMPPSRPQIRATTGGLSAAITDTVKLPVSTMVNKRCVSGILRRANSSSQNPGSLGSMPVLILGSRSFSENGVVEAA